jgi:hypothetical protein
MLCRDNAIAADHHYFIIIIIINYILINIIKTIFKFSSQGEVMGELSKFFYQNYPKKFSTPPI